MKTIKVIDLLNKIANGEEVPKRIKYNDKNWNYKDGIMEYISDDTYFCFSNFEFDELNDEVEIIEEDNKDNFTGWKMYQDGIEVCSMDCSTNEEHKIPEKLYHCCMETNNEEIKFLIKNINDMSDKINEILDYLEEENE